MVCAHFGVSLTVFASLMIQFGPTSLQTEVDTLPDVTTYLNLICSNAKDCKNDGPKSINPSSPIFFCCLVCSCEASCVEQHSCCPNSPHVSDVITPYKSGLNDVVCRNTLYSGKPKNVYLHPEYEFVETCLETADETTKQKCENAAHKNDSGVYDNIPVYDPDSQKNYANIHCAKCNIGSTADFLVWQPKLKCDGDVDLQMISTNIDLGIKEYNCEVIFVPPSDGPEIPPCFNDVITECNVTGDLVVYDELGAYFCQNLDMLYVSIVNQTRKYRNIFCAKCNGENIYAMMQTECPFKPTLDTTSAVTTLVKYTLSDVQQTGDAGVNQYACPRGYKYETFTEECKQLLCSPPYYLDVTTLTCRLFHQSMINVKMLHSFYMKFYNALQYEKVLPLVNEIYPNIRADRAMYTCEIGVYYQTDIIGHSNNLPQNISTTNITVNGVYLMIYSTIQNYDPREAYQTYSELILDHILSVNNTNITILGPETFDQGMLQFDDTDEAITIEYEEFTIFKDGRPSHYLFVNPYDSAIILGRMYNTFGIYCLPNIYKNDFMDCPAHIYKFNDEFRRVADGLAVKYKTSEILFPFDQFKTASSSTVRICSQAVNDKLNQASHSRSLFYNLTYARFILVFLLLSTTIP